MDELIERCGSFGKYQKILLGIIGYITAVNGLLQFLSVFNNAVPQLTCHLKSSHLLHPDKQEFYQLDSCDVFANISLSHGQSIETPYECEYDTTYFGSTIVNEWSLICDKIHLVGLTQTLYMVGAMSSVINGLFSDHFGRKKVCVVLAFLLCSSMLACELCQFHMFALSSMTKYCVYAATQFLIGFCAYGLDIITYVVLMEFTTPRHMTFITIYNCVMYATGQLVLLVICFLARDWRVQNWCASVAVALGSFAVIFILPESPRFLVVKKRYDSACQVLLKMASFNGNGKVKRLSNPLTEESISTTIREMTNDAVEITKLQESTLLVVPRASFSAIEARKEEATREKEDIKPTVRRYLTNPFRNTINTVALAYLWMSIALIYFGMTIGVTSINKNFNPYMMYLLTIIAEICGYLLGLFGEQYSKKSLIALYLGLTALVSLPVALIPPDSDADFDWSINKISIIIFATMGKVFCSTAVYLLYHFSTLVYPTSVRNTLVSSVTSFGRLGAVLAPQVNLLRFLVWQALPYYVFSFNTLLACLTVVILPNDKKIKHDI